MLLNRSHLIFKRNVHTTALTGPDSLYLQSLVDDGAKVEIVGLERISP